VLCGGQDTNPQLGLPSIELFFGQAFDLAFGFRRLAILDLSPAGHQPMASSDGGFWIIFNGEIYNYSELRAELLGYGHQFKTGTDTEVILAAYQQWGTECLSRFNGMWAFALWDHNKQQLFIARDRFGIKPLYYVRGANRFTFASEIKALVGKHGIQYEPDGEAIYRYLASGILPSPQGGHTFFKGVESLPPGHQMMVQCDASEKHRYWTLAFSGEAMESKASDVIQQYRELFTDSVQLRLRADVPVGTCLSGGLDSSSIVCMVNNLMAQGGLTATQIGQQQRTFSAVYDTAGPYNERDHIERVVQATGVEKNLTVPTIERLRDDIERLVWHQDEPFQSTSIFAQWCVMSKVHDRKVTVLLDGQGADETLGGYRPFAIFLSDLLRQAKFLRAVQEARAIQTQTELSVGPLLARALAWQLPASWVRALRQRRYAPQADISALNPDFAANWDAGRVVDWKPWSDLQTHLSDLIQESSLPHLLRYEDRNSMAFSVEARVPFLDYRLVQFSFAQAADWRIYQGWTKWILRKAMDGIVPDEIVWRKDKVGFETPEADWMHEWLRSEPDLFGGDALGHPYLNLNTVRRQVDSWITTGGDVRPIWRWINLEMWLRAWRLA
jgi:asparagine synthase (glutamine-hydrolysing)